MKFIHKQTGALLEPSVQLVEEMLKNNSAYEVYTPVPEKQQPKTKEKQK